MGICPEQKWGRKGRRLRAALTFSLGASWAGADGMACVESNGRNNTPPGTPQITNTESPVFARPVVSAKFRSDYSLPSRFITPASTASARSFTLGSSRRILLKSALL